MSNSEYERPRIPITCADGYRISVQANRMVDCSPFGNDKPSYYEVDVEYEWSKGKDRDAAEADRYRYGDPYDVLAIAREHGGIVDGELPPMGNRRMTDLWYMWEKLGEVIGAVRPIADSPGMKVEGANAVEALTLMRDKTFSLWAKELYDFSRSAYGSIDWVAFCVKGCNLPEVTGEEW